MRGVLWGHAVSKIHQRKNNLLEGVYRLLPICEMRKRSKEKNRNTILDNLSLISPLRQRAGEEKKTFHFLFRAFKSENVRTPAAEASSFLNMRKVIFSAFIPQETRIQQREHSLSFVNKTVSQCEGREKVGINEKCKTLSYFSPSIIHPLDVSKNTSQ